MDEIDNTIQAVIEQKNREPIADFLGYSASSMKHILYDLFGKESPVKITSASEETYQHIPILKQAKFLLHLVNREKEIKLTPRGFLPTKNVAELYNTGFMPDYAIEQGISKLYQELSAETVHVTRVLLELTKLVKKRQNKLSLTKYGLQHIDNDKVIFEDIFTTFSAKLNWAYFDGYTDTRIGQLGFGFTLILLEKYGDDFKNCDFYAQKYFTAYPFFLENHPSSYMDEVIRAYCLRTFSRCLHYFGLIEYASDEYAYLFDKKSEIKKTTAFDQLIKVLPPDDNYSDS